MTTSIDKTRFNQLIKNFQFKGLFNELGWDSVRKKEQIAVENELYHLDAVADKKGFVIFVCSTGNNGRIPDYHTRKKIDSAITKLYFEHLIIFCNLYKKHQIWQLVIREQGKPTAVRETNYYVHQEPEFLYQKLKGLFFSIDDEEKISIVDVKSLIQEQFNTNAEKVTKRFYDQFKEEHTSFLKFIKGIRENVDKDWYASLMLNRLMFIYFIQKKGFLDNDKDYLKNRMKATQEKRGRNKFYSFYRNFLLILFHKGLGSHERTPELIKEIGVVPYLNGGLFDVHHIERKYKDTEIPDEAFEQVFRFFDQYEWHLDTRITATGKDINPDVIGYIFEKYINDRASMGAYYTKEDITDYIGKNCLIPYLFDEVKRNYLKAFNPDGEIWNLLQTDPDKYIYDTVKHGTVVPVGAKHSPAQPAQVSSAAQESNSSKRLHTPENASPLPLPLPPEIAEGLNDVSQRTLWNKSAPPEYGLPTEIWREVVERRKRYAEIKTKIENGEIHEINDFITYNLNIRQFIQDVIENSDDSEFIKHFYKALLNISILDPTCGSGAFLFAAINILEPLYEACIQRMEAFVTDAKNSLPESGQRGVLKNSPLERGQRGVLRYKFFEDTLQTVKSPEHPNLQYFIYKNIILNNIYGVDIMHEAVEIAKLRLFLKLVATIDVDYKKKNLGLEPLPDIDFNIRAGNTLVGFAKLEEVEKVVKGSFYETWSKKEIDAIKEQAEMVKMAYEHFKDSQMLIDSPAMSGVKKDLEGRLRRLNKKLNIYLAQLYGIAVNNPSLKKGRGEGGFNKFEKWKSTHQPFHWFAEFYGIIHDKGGFDVIIGNPPYVEYSKVRKNYTLNNYRVQECGNLFGFVCERARRIISEKGYFSLIVPISVICTQRMECIQKLSFNSKEVWLSNYAERPSKLFTGAEVLLTIFIVSPKKNSESIYTTSFIKWKCEERPILFEKLFYSENSLQSKDYVIPKIGYKIETDLLKIKKGERILAFDLQREGQHKIFYRIGGGRYWKVFTDFSPNFILNGVKTISSRENYLFFKSETNKKAIISILSSSLFYWYFILTTNCRDLNPSDLKGFPFSIADLKPENLKMLSKLCDELMVDYKKNSQLKEKVSAKTGNITYQEFYPRLSKPIIDEIDKVLAEHYGFTDEELDFIINYDIKYRMGKDYDDNT
jgi:methylase of polypeptide subunit release factors